MTHRSILNLVCICANTPKTHGLNPLQTCTQITHTHTPSPMTSQPFCLPLCQIQLLTTSLKAFPREPITAQIPCVWDHCVCVGMCLCASSVEEEPDKHLHWPVMAVVVAFATKLWIWECAPVCHTSPACQVLPPLAFSLIAELCLVGLVLRIVHTCTNGETPAHRWPMGRFRNPIRRSAFLWFRQNTISFLLALPAFASKTLEFRLRRTL